MFIRYGENKDVPPAYFQNVRYDLPWNLIKSLPDKRAAKIIVGLSQ